MRGFLVLVTGKTMELRPWFRKRRLFIGYAVRNPWWLREYLKPRMITHRRIDLPEVRKRVAEIEAHLSHHSGRERLARLHGHRRRWRGRRQSAELRAAEGRTNAFDT